MLNHEFCIELPTACCLLRTAYCGTKQGVPFAAKRCKMTPAVSVESGSPLIATFWGRSMYRIVKWLAISLLCSVSLGFAEEMTEGRLMRFPDIYKDRIVFSYGGDLWLGSTSGGVARRITTHPGLELFPKFSPDGKWIAFSAQYDGNFNVYVIPSEGGEPKQLTFLPDVVSMPERMGPNNMVITWFPDSKRILFLPAATPITIGSGGSSA